MKISLPLEFKSYSAGDGLISNRCNRAAFTIIEVMIAMGIFFMAIFAILSVVGTNLRIARKLQQQQADLNMLLHELPRTNKFEAGSDSGDFGDFFPGWKWESLTTEVATNGLFQREWIVTAPSVNGQEPVQSHLSTLWWKPESVQGMSPGFGGGASVRTQ